MYPTKINIANSSRRIRLSLSFDVRPGKYIVISPCSLVSRPVYIDKNENLNVL